MKWNKQQTPGHWLHRRVREAPLRYWRISHLLFTRFAPDEIFELEFKYSRNAMSRELHQRNIFVDTSDRNQTRASNVTWTLAKWLRGLSRLLLFVVRFVVRDTFAINNIIIVIFRPFLFGYWTMRAPSIGPLVVQRPSPTRNASLLREKSYAKFRPQTTQAIRRHALPFRKVLRNPSFLTFYGPKQWIE